VNGHVMPAPAAALSALDRGFTLADGVFETMRASSGAIFRLEQHLERLARGARALGIALPPVREMVVGALAAARAAGWHEGSVRCTVSRGIGAPGLTPSSDAEPTVVVALHPPPDVPPEVYNAGLSACIVGGRKNEHAMTAGLKTLAYTESILALLEARRAGADDAIFLDTAGHLSEATASNLFLVRGGALLTPPVSCGALAGVTRGVVFELAREMELPGEERVLEPGELFSADEAFLTSSLRALAPLVRVDGRAVGRGAPGPHTRRLMAAYTELVGRECRG
jgi:branched-chain amino acid aminotransferase